MREHAAIPVETYVTQRTIVVAKENIERLASYIFAVSYRFHHCAASAGVL